MTLFSIPEKKSRDGFTLIEILMVIALTSIVAVVSMEYISDSADEGKFQQTVSQLNQIRNAMIGDPTILEGGTRTSFGFLGDIGAIPTDPQGINALIKNPGLKPSFTIDPTTRVGSGWNGPYLSSGNSGVNYLVDAWGTKLVFGSGASPPFLMSYGADKASGGTGLNQDITVTLPTELTKSVVEGYICQTGGPFTGNADVELNYPDGMAGGVRSSLLSLAPVVSGYFQFTKIPFGIRSITIYVPNKGAPTTTIGPVLITIDKPVYTVPCGRIDVSP